MLWILMFLLVFTLRLKYNSLLKNKPPYPRWRQFGHPLFTSMNRWFKHVVSRFTNTTYIPSNYEKLSRTQLIQRIQTLENRLKKSHDKIKVDHGKPIDMSQYGERRIALKIAYLGWNYSGFASQGDETVTPTVEGQLFKALRRCNLIIDQDTCQFTRCGRTDKGVSGLGQVVALNVRSKQNKLAAEGSMPYIEIMNRLLPEDIRVLAWAPVSDTFNARFDCKSRTYKYFFEKGSLDLELMREAAKYMTGSHDFRNFCKLDPSKNITNYERTILYLDILPMENGFYQVELKGTAFLWHQVRCIMSILFLVGQKLEKPEVVKALLDTKQVSSRPDYPMASDLPLMLYDCEFDGIQWIYANDGYRNIPTPLRTYRHFHELWSTHMIKGFLVNTVLQQIEHESVVNHQKVSQAIKLSEAQQSNVLLGAGKSIRTAQYKPILSRQRADSDQVKKEKYRLKQLNKSKI